jgi:hypothetical protein
MHFVAARLGTQAWQVPSLDVGRVCCTFGNHTTFVGNPVLR